MPSERGTGTQHTGRRCEDRSGAERDHHGLRSRAGQPDRGPHRLQRRLRPAHGHRPGGDRCLHPFRRRRASRWRPRFRPGHRSSSALDRGGRPGCPGMDTTGGCAGRVGPSRHRRLADVTTTLPVGAGLSSSAALCVALARAFGVEGTPFTVARLCREAEHRVGAPVGLMDPWVCAGGWSGHALLLDFGSETATGVPVPSRCRGASSSTRAILGRFGHPAYRARVAECEAAEAIVGPLGSATGADLAGLRDPVLRRRARHVVTECERVRATAEALAASDLVEAGRLMGREPLEPGPRLRGLDARPRRAGRPNSRPVRASWAPA